MPFSSPFGEDWVSFGVYEGRQDGRLELPAEEEMVLAEVRKKGGGGERKGEKKSLEIFSKFEGGLTLVHNIEGTNKSLANKKSISCTIGRL